MKRKVLQLERGSLVEKEEIIETRKNKKNQTAINALGNSLGFGFSIAMPIVGGLLLGLYSDNKFSTKPVLTLTFLFTGVALSMTKLVIIAKKGRI